MIVSESRTHQIEATRLFGDHESPHLHSDARLSHSAHQDTVARVILKLYLRSSSGERIVKCCDSRKQ